MKPLLQVAGGLGLAGVVLGLAVLLSSCAGFDAALFFSPAVIVLGLASLILTTLATRQLPSRDNSSILASLFLAALCLVGGLIELAIWLHWPILFSQQP